MAITVHKVYQLRDGAFVPDGRQSSQQYRREGVVVRALCDLPPHPRADGPQWTIDMRIRDGANVGTIPMTLEPFMSAAEYAISKESPVSFDSFEMQPPETKDTEGIPRQTSVWIYRDALYVTDRVPKPSELDEVILRIKALQFQDDEAFKRLREQVANMEAASRIMVEAARKQIPEDVKLLIWSRDGGSCVRCGAKSELHFDHIIPMSRGGGDHAENIQLLCRSCNLAKGNRLF